MAVRLLTVFLLLNAFTSNSQNFPYLNASTGNARQSFTDVDTNIYMYQSNMLEKLSKNLTPKWVKLYANLSLNSVLLTKTGSMYFIGKNSTNPIDADKIGKLDASGNIVWIKSLNTASITLNSVTSTLSSVNAKQLMLDRNNNLVITGITSYSNQIQNGFFIKLDTLGTFLKTRIFKNPNTSILPLYFQNFNVINDSLGNYKIYGDGVVFGGYNGFIANYSDIVDSINKVSPFFINGSNYSPNTYFYKSKYGSNFYVGATLTNNQQYSYTTLYKFATTGSKWFYNLGFWGQNNLFNQLQEDEKGNLFLLSDAYPFGNYNKGFIGLDSNGLYNGINTRYFVNYPFVIPNIPASQLHIQYSGKYFYDVVGANFPTNPLTLGNSTLACTSTLATGTLSAGTPFISFNGNICPKTLVSSLTTATAFTTQVYAINNFSVAYNFCNVLGIEDNSLKSTLLDVYPNPTNGKITIRAYDNNAGITLYDVFGKTICNLESKPYITQNIDLTWLPAGIYFLKCGSATKKIIKEN